MSSPGRASCGFDFGTSNSSIGRFSDGAPRLIPLQGGSVSMPTAVFFSFDDGHAYFGRDAVERYVLRDEGRFMRSLKSVLGSTLIHETTSLKGQRLRFLDIIALFLSYVRQTAGGPTAVVMGRPVHFVDGNEDSDREAEEQLRTAAEIAGFRDIEFQFEPIAAALDYEQQVEDEQLAFVVDIGGGTSDFSIVRVSPARREMADRKDDILAASGVRVGGTDFDKYLNLRTVMPHLGMDSALRHQGMSPPVWWYHELATWARVNVMYEPRVATDIRRVKRDALEPDLLDSLLSVIERRKGHALLGAVEETKIKLSNVDHADLRLADLPDLGEMPITRQQLEAAITNSVEKVVGSLHRTLQLAGVAAADIDAVFLTGGSSKLPLLRSSVRAIFPDASLIEGDAFGSVATGLTIEAYNRFGE